VSIAHLENRIAGALSLGAKDEFRLYLFMYAKRIGAEGHKSKVEELLNGLVGGVLQDGKGGGFGWFGDGEVICGWPRKELLKGVVLILGKSWAYRWNEEVADIRVTRQIPGTAAVDCSICKDTGDDGW
jgi:protein HIRA/HIR1